MAGLKLAPKHYWYLEIVIAAVPVIVNGMYKEPLHASGVYKTFGGLDAHVFCLILILTTLITLVEHNNSKHAKEAFSRVFTTLVSWLVLLSVALAWVVRHEGEELTTLTGIVLMASSIYYCSIIRRDHIYGKEGWK